jgi:hypothetical protein
MTPEKRWSGRGRRPGQRAPAGAAQQTAASTRDVKRMRAEKDTLAEQHYPRDEVRDFVNRYYDPESYRDLEGKDNVYLVMPSTSGRNTIPRTFAERLARDYGGEVLENVARPLSAVEAKSMGVVAKITGTRRYELTHDLAPYRGKNIVIVDDVENTGYSVRGLQRALAEQGIGETRRVALGVAEGEPIRPADLDRLSRKLAATLGEDYTNVRSDVETVLGTVNRKLGADLERRLGAKDGGRVARLIYDRIRSEAEGRPTPPHPGAGLLPGEGGAVRGAGGSPLPVEQVAANPEAAAEAGIHPGGVPGNARLAGGEDAPLRRKPGEGERGGT